MKNIHPVYNIKRLMIVRELEKDPKLKDENWDRFLPTFKKTNVQRKKPRQVVEGRRKEMEEARSAAASAKSTTATSTADETAPGKKSTKKKKKKSYTPFPPAQLPSKIDRQLDSGEYFLSERERKDRKLAEKKSVSMEKTEAKRRAREEEFVYRPIYSSASKESGGVGNGNADGRRSVGDLADGGGKRKRDDAVNPKAEDMERMVKKFAKKG